MISANVLLNFCESPISILTFFRTDAHLLREKRAGKTQTVEKMSLLSLLLI